MDIWKLKESHLPINLDHKIHDIYNIYLGTDF